MQGCGRQCCELGGRGRGWGDLCTSGPSCWRRHAEWRVTLNARVVQPAADAAGKSSHRSARLQYNRDR